MESEDPINSDKKQTVNPIKPGSLPNRPDLQKICIEKYPDGLRRVEDSYQKLEQIGEGTSSKVYRAKDIETGEIVALKEVQLEEKYILEVSKREVDTLRMLQHENIVQLKEVVFSPDSDQPNTKGSLFMVFEYMNHDLLGLMNNREVKFTEPKIKCYMKQLLKGLHYCHDKGVHHRDIKEQNILLDDKENLKIADFGACTFPNDSRRAETNVIVSLWYRPPELLLGSLDFLPSVDMWSAGVVFAELMCRRIFLRGTDEHDQLNKIYAMFGGAYESNWPGVSNLPYYNEWKPTTEMEGCFRKTFECLDQHAVNLLERMLTLDPSQRISAKDALQHDYFCIDSLPADPTRNEKKRQHAVDSTGQDAPIPSTKCLK